MPVSVADVRDAQNLEAIHVLGISGNSREVSHSRDNQQRSYRGLQRDQKKEPMSNGDFQ